MVVNVKCKKEKFVSYFRVLS